LKIRIDEIKANAKKRIRKDTGDLSGLMRSISKFGLLQPVILNKNYELIAGYRRLQAAIQLGWQTIDAVIMNSDDKLTKLEIEIEENVIRKDFTYDEIDAAYEKK
jgi:ParB family chromosome partitioning protein